MRLICLLVLMSGLCCHATEKTEYNDETEHTEIPAIAEKEHKSIFDLLFSKEGQQDDTDTNNDQNQKTIRMVESNEGVYNDIAVIKVIDRTLGKLYLLEVPVRSGHNFNGLTFKVIKCWNPDKPGITSGSRALINISRADRENTVNLFHGWMIANHPGVSYMEHEKYDVSLKLCKAIKTKENKADDQIIRQ